MNRQPTNGAGTGWERSGAGTDGLVRISMASGAPLDAYLTLPPAGENPERLLVAVHGIGRDAVEQATLWGDWARHRRVQVLAPMFGDVAFQGFQRLERGIDGRTADGALVQLLRWLPAMGIRLPVRRILFGHSGGAQFAHRFLMANPFAMDAAILSSAGWYTWPEGSRRFPYGLGKPLDRAVSSVELDALLRVPLLVTVGENDNEPDPQLRRRQWIDAQQGIGRRERAGRWVRALQSEAARRRVVARLEHRVLPGAGHAFAECMAAGLPGHVGEFLGALPWLWRSSASIS